MRSVERGAWPTGNDDRPVVFPQYRHAKGPLVERIGEYCSYCERPGDLHVEHVVPKCEAPALEREWSNFLLGCVNCNSRKSDRNTSRVGYLWPDSDDTFGAFVYRSGGRVSVNERLVEGEHRKASALSDLVGLGAMGTRTDRRRHKRHPGMGSGDQDSKPRQRRGFTDTCSRGGLGNRILQCLDGSVSRRRRYAPTIRGGVSGNPGQIGSIHLGIPLQQSGSPVAGPHETFLDSVPRRRPHVESTARDRGRRTSALASSPAPPFGPRSVRRQSPHPCPRPSRPRALSPCRPRPLRAPRCAPR